MRRTRSEWVDKNTMSHILMALTEPNRLAIEMSIRYGMRIGDVLATKRKGVEHGSWTYKEEKTGKSRRIRLCPSFQARLLRQSGRIWVFEGRLSYKRHRTRQAVYKDIRRASRAFRVKAHVSPHTARKMYAVDAFHRTRSVEQVMRLLNHSNEAVTMLYALADALTEKRRKH